MVARRAGPVAARRAASAAGSVVARRAASAAGSVPGVGRLALGAAGGVGRSAAPFTLTPAGVSRGFGANSQRRPRTGPAGGPTLDDMSTALLTVEGSTQRIADVEIVIPVYNEEADLEASVRRLHHYLTERFPLSWVVTIADNASRRPDVGHRVPPRRPTLPGVRAVAPRRRRDAAGPCARRGWRRPRRVVAYMDVDLSTDLDALLPLVAPLLTGHSDVAIGSRLAQRRPRRAGARSARSSPAPTT